MKKSQAQTHSESDNKIFGFISSPVAWKDD